MHYYILNIGSPVQHGWVLEDGCYVQYAGPMASEVLDSRICTCGGKNKCSRASMCHAQVMGCTEMCPCTTSV